MQNHNIEKLIRGQSEEELRDLGVGLGLLRQRSGLLHETVATEFLGAVGGFSGKQALSIIELGWAAWMAEHPGAVAKLVWALWDDWRQHGLQHSRSVAPPSPADVIEVCQDLRCATNARTLLVYLQLAAAAAVVHGVRIEADLVETHDDRGAIVDIDQVYTIIDPLN